jgi:hypothetical protein
MPRFGFHRVENGLNYIVLAMIKGQARVEEPASKEDALAIARDLAETYGLATNYLVSGPTVSLNHVRVVEQGFRDGVLVRYEDIAVS